MATIPRGYQGTWVAVPGTGGWNKGPSRYIREYSWAGGRGGGGGAGYTAPNINIPGFGSSGSSGGGNGYNVPSYNIPGVNTSRIEELRTKALNPQLRGIRNNLRTAIVRNRVAGNPYAEAQRQKQLLAGTGQAISGATSGAYQTAMGQYAPEYQAAVNRAGALYQGALQRNLNVYQGNLQRGNLAYQAGVNATMARAQMQHQARMAQLQASLKSQYGAV